MKQRTYNFYKELRETQVPKWMGSKEEITYIEVGSHMMPYMSPEEFEVFVKEKVETGDYHWNKVLEESLKGKTVEEETIGKIEFTGKYGPTLLQEVSNYGLVAAEIAQNQEFDLIHAHDWLTYAAGIAAKRVSGKPLVIHVHATEFDRSGENVNTLVYDIEKMGMEAASAL